MKTHPSRVSVRRALPLISLVLATVVWGCNGGYNNTQQVVVSVAPQTVTIKTGQTQQFTATVTGTMNTAVTWQVLATPATGIDLGSISASGLYTPPAVPPSVVVSIKATSQADSTKSFTATANVTDGTAPSTPTGLNANAISATQVSLTWTASTDNVGVTGYQVERCNGNGCTPGTQAGTPTTNSFNDTGLTPSTSYTYSVSSTDAAGNVSAVSAAKSATTQASGGGPIAVSITPVRDGLTVTQKLSMTPTVSGDSANAGVTWSFTSTGPTAGGSFSSPNSASGTPVIFTAPSGPGVVTVTATSVSDGTKLASATIGVTDLAGVFTYHNDISRTGSNAKEFALTTPNVTTATFGKLFSCPVDAAVYAQPLWVANLSFSGVKHNVVYVATEHDTVYAFDADSAACTNLWGGAKSLLASGETWVNANADTSCGDLRPDIGITGTPVIDSATNTLYVVTKSKTTAAPSTFHQRLHALDLTTGADKAAFAEISAQVNGTGNGSTGGKLNFDPLLNAQRPALLLSNDSNGRHVIIAWAAHCDFGSYHGWVMSYNPTSLAQEAVWNASPNGGQGGIWMSGNGPAADSSGNIYFATGNGNFNANTSGTEYGDAIVKLGPPNTVTGTFQVMSYFAPLDQATLNTLDADLGSGGLILLPDLVGGAHPQLLTQAGKDGRIWVADGTSLGLFSATSNNVVEEVDGKIPGGMWGSPAYWNGNLYFGAAADGSSSSDPLRAFSFSTTTGVVSSNATSQSAKIFGFSGPTPSVSSNGNLNGIVWALDNGNWGSSCPNSCQVVYAYDATNLATKLWDSTQAASNRDRSGGAVKFVVPTVANGKVYVGGQNSVTVYGLLPN